jgi:hypothetical protein
VTPFPRYASSNQTQTYAAEIEEQRIKREGRRGAAEWAARDEEEQKGLALLLVPGGRGPLALVPSWGK